MKKNRFLALLIVLVLVVAAGSMVWAGEKSVTAPGQQKNNSGCISCHQGTATLPDGTVIDITLAGEVNSRLVPEGHPEVKAGITITHCMKCHQKEGVMDEFKDKLHDVHWNSPLLEIEFGAKAVTDRCTFCHNMSYIRGYNDSAGSYAKK